MSVERPRAGYWLWLGVVFCTLTLVLALLPMSGPPGTPGMDKVLHGVAFAGLGGWFGALSGDQRRLAVVAVALLAFGLAIEVLQGWAGWRDASLADLAADLAGVVLGLWLLRSVIARTLRYIEARVGPASDRI